MLYFHTYNIIAGNDESTVFEMHRQRKNVIGWKRFGAGSGKCRREQVGGNADPDARRYRERNAFGRF